MKKYFLSLFLCAMLFTLLPGAAFAASGSVTLTPRQDSAGVTVTLPQGADSGVTSLRLSFQVDLTGGDAGKTGAQFNFDGALPGSVHEYRYDAQTGRLNLYVAGRDPLFTDNTVHLGSLVLTTGDAAGAAASVTVVENSLELVNAAYGADKPGVDAQTVELAVGTTQEPSAPEEDTSSSSPSSSSASSTVSSAPAASQPAGNTADGGTVSASSSSKAHAAGAKPQSGSSSVSEGAESDVSQAPQSASSSASSRVPDASSSVSQSEAPASSTGRTVMYVVIGVLIAAVLIAAFVVFKRRK